MIYIFFRTNSIVGAGTKFRLLSAACSEGRDAAVKLLRQRFRMQQQDSFNSEASSHLTIDRQDFLFYIFDDLSWISVKWIEQTLMQFLGNEK